MIKNSQNYSQRVVNFREQVVQVISRLPQPFSTSRVQAELGLTTPSQRKRLRYHLDRLEEEGILQLSHRGIRGEKYYQLRKPPATPPQAPPSLPSSEGPISITPRTHPADSIQLNASRLDPLSLTSLLEEAVNSAHDAILITSIQEKHITPAFTTLIDLHPQHTFTIHLTSQTQLTDDTLIRLARRKNVHLLISQPTQPNPTYHELVTRLVKILQQHAGSMSIHTPPHPLSYPGRYGLYPSIQDDTLTITTHGALLIDYPRLAEASYHEMRQAILTQLKKLFTHTLRSTLITPLHVRRVIHLIRFWNYGIKEEESDPESIAAFLSSMRDELNAYAHAQEIILKSSGMPLTYQTMLSVLFDQAKPPGFTQRRFTPIRITSLKQLLEDETVKRKLREKERVTSLFTGGDRTRIFHTTPANPDEVLEEIRFLTSSYALPIITIAFTTPAQHAPLTQYLKQHAR